MKKLTEEILDDKNITSSLVNENALITSIETLFNAYHNKQERGESTHYTARIIYDAIIDLALAGKAALVEKYQKRYEQEIGERR
ncbi:MAG: hypothetical protein GY754_30615 [bacterium]|nr:hypothetical protein [bacterium]